MGYTSFKVTIENHIGHVAFDRPEKSNSLHKEMWQELKDVFEEMSDTPEVRVVVLSGEGKNFCAGIDLAMLMAFNNQYEGTCEARKREKVRESIFYLQDCISSIEKCRKPVLAAIHKACIGGGVDIISACDIRYCTDDAYFSIREVDMGLVADIGTMQRLPKILNSGIVAELAYTGRDVGGQEAVAINLCNKSYANKEEMMSGVMDIAKTIASKSPMVIRGTKETLLYTRDHSVDESLKQIANFNAAFLQSNDITKAFEAFMTKQAPVFEN